MRFDNSSRHGPQNPLQVVQMVWVIPLHFSHKLAVVRNYDQTAPDGLDPEVSNAISHLTPEALKDRLRFDSDLIFLAFKDRLFSPF